MNGINVRPMDITPGIQALSQGLQRRGERKGQEALLAQAAEITRGGDPEQISQFMIKNPSVAKTMQQATETDRSIRTNESLDQIGRIVGGSDPLRVLGERAQLVSERGGDPQDTLQLLETFKTNPEQGMAEIETQWSFLDPQGYQSFKKSQGGGAGAVDKQKTGAFLVTGEDGQPAIAVGVFDPSSGGLVTETATIPAGSLISKLGETAKEETKRRIDEAGKKKDVEVITATRSEAISKALEAAKTAPTLRRSIQLLKDIETGGIDKVSKDIKSMFGIESADEGELSYLLGEAVLKQLKPTFGSQFTVTEGNELKKIMAGIGKSPAANRRILTQILQMTEAKIKRGKRYASAAGYEDLLKDITDFDAISYEPSMQPQATGVPQTITTQAEFDSIPSGTLFIEDGKQYRKP